MNATIKPGQLRRKLWERLKGQSFAEQMMEDQGLRPYERREREEVLALLPDPRGKRVADLGAGVGRFTSEFAERAASVVAVDMLEHALEKNRARNARFDNIHYVCVDAMSLVLPNASVDIVFSSWLLMYLDEGEVLTFLEHCVRWLAPGGQVFFKESCETNVTGHSAEKVAAIGLLQKFTGVRIDRYVVSAPTWTEIWAWLRRKKGAQSVYYRSAAEYEAMFAQRFSIVRSGYIRVFEELYDNRNQRYWLLEPKG